MSASSSVLIYLTFLRINSGSGVPIAIVGVLLLRIRLFFIFFLNSSFTNDSEIKIKASNISERIIS